MPTKIRRKQLSLRGLRTFVVAARHRSFRLAGEELFITASAVSHQIKSLEQEVGTALFERQHRGIALTDAGEALFARVAGLLDEIDRATAPFRDGQTRHVLRLSVQPYFASEQLMPRLTGFIEDHPHIDLHLDSTDEQPHRHPASADASVRLFRAAPEGLVADAIYPLRFVTGCSPERLARLTGDEPLTQPFPMIVHSDRKQDWQHWAHAAGVELPKDNRLIELNSMVAVVNAACEGVGVALIPMPLSDRLFKRGTLVRAHRFEYATPDRYYFVTTPTAARTRPVQALRSWVMGTFAEVA